MLAFDATHPPSTRGGWKHGTGTTRLFHRFLVHPESFLRIPSSWVIETGEDDRVALAGMRSRVKVNRHACNIWREKVNLIFMEDGGGGGGGDGGVVEEGGGQAILLDGKESEEASGDDLAYGRRTAAVGILDPEAPVPSFPRHVERVGKLESVSREVRGRRRGGGRLSSPVVSVPVASFEITIASCKVLAPISPTSTSTSGRDEGEIVGGISPVG
jgi:hypothetical protein